MVIELLSQAFQAEPVMRWIFPDERHRRTLLPALFDVLFAEHLAAHGETLVADDDGFPDGVLLYVPPGPPRQAADHAARLAARLEAAVGPHADRAVTLLDTLTGRHPGAPAHYHVAYCAVRPGRQGRGIGGALLRGLLERADLDGVGTYAECSTSRLLDLGVRHGFAPLPMIPLPDGPVVRPAWREPVGP
ncbi:GNAT family N-acetyltransferase [Streptomyces avicenniae]|uniref:GNAT family N-acetyltransferase n=1 Tax=Streptomyces avicenniae TaxID=500153 RepID=UPI00069B0266|nr:GNAT family N-acetyltransferase [Streptomyces avicenniae]